MQLEGYEGYTLPMQLHEEQALFRCILGAGSGNTAPKKPADRPIRLDDAYDHATLCMFNDGGTRLQQENPAWLQSEPWASKPAIDRTWAVMKLHEPSLAAGWIDGHHSPLITELYNLLPGRVILVMNADDLRRNGAAVSRSLSWERSVRDVVGLIQSTAQCGLQSTAPKHIAVTFDYDAALYLRVSKMDRKSTVAKAILAFSTKRR